MTSEGNELEDDDDDEEITPVVGRPVSRMTNFAGVARDGEGGSGEGDVGDDH